MVKYLPFEIIVRLIALLIAFPSISQEFDIVGLVSDKSTSEPLIAATIQSGKNGTLTDENGKFKLSLVPGTHTIHVRYLGFQSYDREIQGEAGDSIYLDIGLIPDDHLLQQVVISTGKYEKPLSETTVSLEIVKPALLAETNSTSIDEVLDRVPGVAIIDGQPNIRGGSGYSYGAGSRVLLMIDDIPALQADAGFPNWDDFPVENLAQMEVVKGASSALYGSSALNGIINIRTAYATDKPTTKLNTFYTSYLSPKDQLKKWWSKAPREYGISLTDARRFGKLDFVGGFNYLNRSSFQKGNYDRYFRFNAKVRYRFSKNIEIGMNSNFNKGEGQDFFFWINERDSAYIGGPSNLSISDRVRYIIDPYVKITDRKGNRHVFKGRIFDVNNMNNANRSNESNLYYGEYQFLKRLFDWNAIITVGAVGIRTSVNAPLYGDTTFISNNGALYMQFEKKFVDRLTINAGIRYERNILKGPSQVGNQSIPTGNVRESKPVVRFGLNYQVAEYTFLRSSWGQGYRYPTIAEKYVSTTFGPIKISPNLILASETGWSAEIGLKQGFQIANLNGFADLALYWSEYNNMMEFVFTGIRDGFQSQNIGDTRIKGVDFSLSGSGELFGFETDLMAGYTYIDPRFRTFTASDSINSSVDYNILKYRSKHLVKMDLQSGIEKIKLGLSLRYTSEMIAIDKVFELFIPGVAAFRETHKGYLIMDIRAKFMIIDKLFGTLLLRNALNEAYSVRPGLLEAPRNLTFRLDFEF